MPSITVLKNNLGPWEPDCLPSATHSPDLSSFKQLDKGHLNYTGNTSSYPCSLSNSSFLWIQAGPPAQGGLSWHQTILPNAESFIVQCPTPTTSEYKSIGDLSIAPISSTPPSPQGAGVGQQSQRVPWAPTMPQTHRQPPWPPPPNREMGAVLVASPLGSMLSLTDVKDIFCLLLERGRIITFKI